MGNQAKLRITLIFRCIYWCFTSFGQKAMFIIPAKLWKIAKNWRYPVRTIFGETTLYKSRISSFELKSIIRNTWPDFIICYYNRYPQNQSSVKLLLQQGLFHSKSLFR